MVQINLVFLPSIMPLTGKQILLWDCSASKNAKLAADAENQQLVMIDNISGNNYNTVSLLLDKKADADKELYGTTPLIVAAGSSSLDVVKLLINSGAKISKTGEKDITPLMSACLTGRP